MEKEGVKRRDVPVKKGLLRVMRCPKCSRQTEWTLDRSYIMGRSLYRVFRCSVCGDVIKVPTD